jgi:hypothetical protein
MGARSSIRRERISFFIAFTYGEGERGDERGERRERHSDGVAVKRTRGAGSLHGSCTLSRA